MDYRKISEHYNFCRKRERGKGKQKFENLKIESTPKSYFALYQGWYSSPVPAVGCTHGDLKFRPPG
jgi:hypothetical protein